MVLLMPLQQSYLHHTILPQKRNWHHEIALKDLWMFKKLPSNVWNHSLNHHEFRDVIFEFAWSISASPTLDFEFVGCHIFFTPHVILSFDSPKLHSANAHLVVSTARMTTVLRKEFVGFISSLILLKSAPAKAFFEIFKIFGCVIKKTQLAQLHICFSICIFVRARSANTGIDRYRRRKEVV
jgi:hypothetical protein